MKYKPASYVNIKGHFPNTWFGLYPIPIIHFHSLSFKQTTSSLIIMKSAAVVLVSSLSTIVAGHGYLVTPDSRTKLGFEVRHLDKLGIKEVPSTDNI